MSALTVLNTRPREQAAELSALLREAGFHVIEAPAISIESAWSPSELATVTAELRHGAYDWVVLASANAAYGLPLTGVRIVCGAATARALGIDAALTLERFSASAALESLLPLLRPGDRVLVPRAAEGRDDLIAGLLARGVHVDAPVSYRTVAAPAAALRHVLYQPVDIVTLCSPSALHALTAALGTAWLSARRIACLGETTAAAARAADVPVQTVAEETSMASLVEAITTLVGANV